jgi:hypothetical protein
MTVIAWDGQTLAVDRQINAGNLRHLGDKGRMFYDSRLGLEFAVAWCGACENGITKANWFQHDRDPARWPNLGEKEGDYALLVVACRYACWGFHMHPIAQRVLGPYAWGSGRDYAISAMGLGLTAPEAITHSFRFDTSCGMGVSVFTPR